MDPRAELLIDELSTLPLGETVDFHRWQHRFQSLLGENLDPEGRQGVLQSYADFLDFFERGLVAQGHDPEPFRNVRKADWNTLCIQEALQRSGTDLFHPDDLHEIVQREVAADRFTDSDFVQFAADSAAVLGNDRTAQPRKGFFRRLFG